MDTLTLPNLLNFSGEVVLVTGATGNIGAAIARRFAAAGAHVAVHTRTHSERAEAVAASIREHGRQAIVVSGDVGDPDQAAHIVRTVHEQWGRLSVLVNNAGVYPTAALMDMTIAEWDAMMHANLRSVFVMTQVAASLMRGQPDALNAIVNIASIEGLHPVQNHSHYSTSKAGVLMHTRAAALELGANGIRVNCISPGLIQHDDIRESWPEGVAHWESNAPLVRMGTPDDVADACLFLGSRAARWITGANLVVDGGISAKGWI